MMIGDWILEKLREKPRTMSALIDVAHAHPSDVELAIREMGRAGTIAMQDDWTYVVAEPAEVPAVPVPDEEEPPALLADFDRIVVGGPLPGRDNLVRQRMAERCAAGWELVAVPRYENSAEELDIVLFWKRDRDWEPAREPEAAPPPPPPASLETKIVYARDLILGAIRGAGEDGIVIDVLKARFADRHFNHDHPLAASDQAERAKLWDAALAVLCRALLIEDVPDTDRVRVRVCSEAFERKEVSEEVLERVLARIRAEPLLGTARADILKLTRGDKELARNAIITLVARGEIEQDPVSLSYRPTRRR